MKKLILVRHAKSSWQTAAQSDFERPLNDRGHRDAPVMAKRLKQLMPDVDAFVSSPAKRALTTAGYFAAAWKISEKQIIQVPSLYHAPPAVFTEVIRELDDALTCVALFAHNPGITEFINELTQVRVDNMPTCAIFAVEIAADSWKQLETAEKKFLFFDYPKNV
jgi:phosphohistidine phosphatase